MSSQPEITAKLAALGVAIYEVPINRFRQDQRAGQEIVSKAAAGDFVHSEIPDGKDRGAKTLTRPLAATKWSGKHGVCRCRGDRKSGPGKPKEAIIAPVVIGNVGLPGKVDRWQTNQSPYGSPRPRATVDASADRQPHKGFGCLPGPLLLRSGRTETKMECGAVDACR